MKCREQYYTSDIEMAEQNDGDLLSLNLRSSGTGYWPWPCHRDLVMTYLAKQRWRQNAKWRENIYEEKMHLPSEKYVTCSWCHR